ncbi:unnamed protein product, partial [Allacma fusca]
ECVTRWWGDLKAIEL